MCWKCQYEWGLGTGDSVPTRNAALYWRRLFQSPGGKCKAIVTHILKANKIPQQTTTQRHNNDTTIANATAAPAATATATPAELQ